MSRRPIRRFSVREALDLFFQTDEDGIGVEPEIEEDVSEIEAKDPDFDPDHHETEQSTYGEEEAPEEEAPGEEAPVEDTPEVTFQSTPASCSLVRSLQAPATALATLPPKQGQKRKRCKLCAPRDNKTSLTCFKCDAYVCKTHCDLIAKCHSCV
ncbi:unnamed protein product [Pleuronectes platessa]|uniref:PiggyBac transposable element-derived protein 4 C-terminal zinc-ribbon domain-containing protein n=1 Tax=Pleuronectes platessa TaxID=8262 RepID=A0A9N7YTW0_PLEPL|nr:unnamed protein product [Pleuronectes platessa]CAB1445852.1 unnamed protein product [Pleuronectes platessa]